MDSAVVLLLIYIGLALGISFLCSLSEATLLSVRQVTLVEKRDAGSRGAGLLLQIKAHRTDDALSAVLTLNTIANTAGSALAGNQMRAVLGPQHTYLEVGTTIFAAVLTLMVLFLSEIPPKTLGAFYSSQFAGPVGWMTHFLLRAMKPFLLVTRALTRALAPPRKSDMSRRELAAFIAMAAKEGAIELEERNVLANLLQFGEIHVVDIMTPRTVAMMIPEDTTLGEFLRAPENEPYSRIPVYRDQRDNVTGYVLARDLLRALARGDDEDTPVSSYLRRVWYLPEVVSMFDALQQFMERREHIAIVTDEHGGVSGLATLEDLVETILGVEILDESDRHADLRELAGRLRDQRMERLRGQQSLAHGSSPGSGPTHGPGDSPAPDAP